MSTLLAKMSLVSRYYEISILVLLTWDVCNNIPSVPYNSNVRISQRASIALSKIVYQSNGRLIRVAGHIQGRLRRKTKPRGIQKGENQTKRNNDLLPETRSKEENDEIPEVC